MGINIEQWRASIGSFVQPAKRSHPGVQTLTLCVKIVLFLLLVAYGVERNPGPPKLRRGGRSRVESTISREDIQPS